MFNGQAEEAAAFYADLLGGQVENLYRYSEMPPVPGMPPIPADAAQRIMHGSISFPGGTISLADTLPDDPRDFGSGHLLTLCCDSVARAETAYGKLIREARKIVCELQKVFYAERYGEVVDKYGILWAVMFEDTTPSTGE
jgi:PhnB protein